MNIVSYCFVLWFETGTILLIQYYCDILFPSSPANLMAQHGHIGNRKFKIGTIDYVHIQGSRAQKDTSSDVLLLLFFITRGPLCCGRPVFFHFGVLHCFLFFLICSLFVPKSYSALQLLPSKFIYHRKGDGVKRRERKRKRGGEDWENEQLYWLLIALLEWYQLLIILTPFKEADWKNKKTTTVELRAERSHNL